MSDKTDQKQAALAEGSFDPAGYLDKLIEAGRIDFADYDSLLDYYVENDATLEAEASPQPQAAAPKPFAPSAEASAGGFSVAELDMLSALPEAIERQPSYIEFSDLFLDPLAYLAANPDLSADTRHPVDHYRLFGFREGRPAPSVFDREDYLTRYPDILTAGLAPFEHFLRHGAGEGRTIRPHSAPAAGASGHRRFRDLLRIITDQSPSLTHHDSAILRWWRAFQSTVALATLQNSGWTGANRISAAESYYGAHGSATASVEGAFQSATGFMQQLFYNDQPPLLDAEISEMLVLKRTKARKVQSQPRRPVSEEGVSVITPFFRHLCFFEECAASVELLRRLTAERLPGTAFEWVLVNDDPDVSMETLRSLVPADLIPHARFVQGGGLKTTGATNLGLATATNGWLLFLDCDDVILPNAVLALEHYSRRFPSRYFSSGMIDTDAEGRAMRYRPHSESALRAPIVGMNAGHLKCIHRTLFEQFGPLDPMFDGCQDYEFLLRFLDHEDVILMPEYLYMYRWHNHTQSVAMFVAQEQRAALAKKIYARGRARRSTTSVRPTRRVAALIRSTGDRIDSLKEAILSCRSLQDAATIEPVVIVHGNAARFDFVKEQVAGLGAHLCHAENTALSRGHPLNVGVKFALEDLGCDGFGVLDDDDIYLPGMHLMATTVDPDALALHAGRVLRKSLDGKVDEPYPSMPAAQFTTSNFLPTNGFIVTRALAEKILQTYGELFPSDMFYLEDYVFLLRAWGAGGDVAHFDMFVGEFRMGSDGNTHERKYPFEFQRCAAKARVFANMLANETKARRAASIDAMPQRAARRISDGDVTQLLETIC
jgi:hypothetical protein